MSAPVSVVIPHQLGRAEAQRRIESGFDRLIAQFGQGGRALDRSWADNRMNFSVQVLGQSISGIADVLDDAVRLEVTLPGFLAVIASKVKGRLQDEGRLLLENKSRQRD